MDFVFALRDQCIFFKIREKGYHHEGEKINVKTDKCILIVVSHHLRVAEEMRITHMTPPREQRTATKN